MQLEEWAAGVHICTSFIEFLVLPQPLSERQCTCKRGPCFNRGWGIFRLGRIIQGGFEGGDLSRTAFLVSTVALLLLSVKN